MEGGKTKNVKKCSILLLSFAFLTFIFAVTQLIMTYIIWPKWFALNDHCEWYGKGKDEALMSENGKLVKYVLHTIYSI